jgi:hypothetical protein
MKAFVLLVVLLCGLTFNVVADVPHVLRNGKVVDANQLNENFNYLSKQQSQYLDLHEQERSDADNNNNNADKSYLTFADGVLIGSSTIKDSQAMLIFNPDFEPLIVLKNGVVIFPESDNSLIRFETEDCSGDRYVEFLNYPLADNGFLFAPDKGKIFNDKSNSQFYYYPPDTKTLFVKIPMSYFREVGADEYECQAATPVCVNGYRRNTQTGQMICDNGNLGSGFYTGDWNLATEQEKDTFLSKFLIKLSPNDPTITNFPNAPFSPPITFTGKNEPILIED